MHYYKHIDEQGNAFQYEATTRAINSPMVVEIIQQEYDEIIANLPKDEEADGGSLTCQLKYQ